MTAEEIIQVISDNNLVVRRLPFEVVDRWLCRKDETVIQKEGEKREIVFNEKTNRYNLVVTRTVKNGGRWLLLQCKNTLSMVQFDLERNIVADTLEEAVKIWLSKQ